MSLSDRLRTKIESGGLGPAGRLPPERELAAEFGVGRNALRRALAELEAEGRIWRHVGRGTFVGARPEPGLAGLPGITRMTNPAEVMEVRLIIEPRVAGLAALRASSVDIAEMERCLRGAEADGDVAAFERWDGALHRAMARASRNTFLLAIFDTVNAVRRDELWGRLKEATLTADRQAAFARQHEALVALIRDRDAPGAEAAMRQHLETVRRNLLDA